MSGLPRPDPRPILDELIIMGNTSNGGSAIYSYTGITFTIKNSEIKNNYYVPDSPINNSGIAIFASTLTVDRVLIRESYGAAIDAKYSSNAMVINSVIANNQIGLEASNSSLIDVYNSILYHNTFESYIYEDGLIQINYSTVESGYNGEGNIINTDPLFSDPENGDYTLQEGSPCIDAGTADLDGDGEDDIEYVGAAPDMGAFEYGALVNVDETKVVPEFFTLHQNYPNPFNPTTILRYNLPEQTKVTLTVYDMLGRQVNQLVNATQEAGYRSVQWNATDSFGKPVSAGVYLYQIRAGEFRQTKKMVLLK